MKNSKRKVKETNIRKSRWGNEGRYIFMVIIPLAVSIILAEAQNSFGIIDVILSFIFLLVIFSGVAVISRKFLVNNIIEKIIIPRFEVALNQPAEKMSTYDYLFSESIIPDSELKEFEADCKCEEIWVVLRSLITEIEGGLYADTVTENLKRGVRYKFFLPKTDISMMHLEQLKKKNEQFETIKYYFLTDGFFLPMIYMDCTIYDPLSLDSDNRKGYIGINLPDKNEAYEIRMEENLLETVIANLFKEIREDI